MEVPIDIDTPVALTWRSAPPSGTRGSAAW